MKRRVRTIKLKTTSLEQTLCLITGITLVSYDHSAGWILVGLVILSLIAESEKKKEKV